MSYKVLNVLWLNLFLKYYSNISKIYIGQRYYIKHCILVSWSWNVIYCCLYVRVLSFILLLLLKQTCVIWSGFETGNLIKFENHFHFLEIPLRTAPRFKNLTTTYHRILILLVDPSEGYTQELIYYVCSVYVLWFVSW